LFLSSLTTTVTYSLSLHDALPIYGSGSHRAAGQSFLLAPRRHGAPAAYPGAARATPLLPYLALPRMGFAVPVLLPVPRWALTRPDRKSTRLNSSHVKSSYAVFCLK